MKSSITTFAGVLVILGAAIGTSRGDVLFSEDFEGVTLGPQVDETHGSSFTNNAWTATPPSGWSVDSSGVPGFGTADDGVTEWAGWSFANKNFWIQVAGDQGRSEFVLGTGNVAIADADEWDDLDHADSAANGWFDAFMSTPAIGIVGGDTLNVSFHSSWKPEFDDNYHQTARVTASFDGGAPVELLLWESEGSSPNFHARAPNEAISLNFAAPADANSVVLEFGLFDAGNDWWWAVDNITVSGQAVPEPTTGNFVLHIIEGISPGTYALSFPTELGLEYQIEEVNSLGMEWEEFGLRITGTGSDHVSQLGVPNGWRFYRVVATSN